MKELENERKQDIKREREGQEKMNMLVSNFIEKEKGRNKKGKKVRKKKRQKKKERKQRELGFLKER